MALSASPWYADECGFNPYIFCGDLIIIETKQKTNKKQNKKKKKKKQKHSAIFSLRLIQEGHFSVTIEKMGTNYW